MVTSKVKIDQILVTSLTKRSRKKKDKFLLTPEYDFNMIFLMLKYINALFSLLIN